MSVYNIVSTTDSKWLSNNSIVVEKNLNKDGSRNIHNLNILFNASLSAPQNSNLQSLDEIAAQKVALILRNFFNPNEPLNSIIINRNGIKVNDKSILDHEKNNSYKDWKDLTKYFRSLIQRKKTSNNHSEQADKMALNNKYAKQNSSQPGKHPHVKISDNDSENEVDSDDIISIDITKEANQKQTQQPPIFVAQSTMPSNQITPINTNTDRNLTTLTRVRSKAEGIVTMLTRFKRKNKSSPIKRVSFNNQNRTLIIPSRADNSNALSYEHSISQENEQNVVPSSDQINEIVSQKVRGKQERNRVVLILTPRSDALFKKLLQNERFLFRNSQLPVIAGNSIAQRFALFQPRSVSRNTITASTDNAITPYTDDAEDPSFDMTLLVLKPNRKKKKYRSLNGERRQVTVIEHNKINEKRALINPNLFQAFNLFHPIPIHSLPNSRQNLAGISSIMSFLPQSSISTFNSFEGN